MNKRNLLLFFLICIFAFTIRVNAEASITCTPTNAHVGDQITCAVKTTEPVEVTTKLGWVAGDTQLEEDGNIVYKAINKGTYDVILKTIGTDIEPSFTTKVKINVVEKTTTTTTTTTKAKSDNNYLSSITIDGEEIEGFKKTTSKYFVEVENDVTKVSLEAEAEDETANVEIDGPKSLEVGDNEYTISVTSESDSTKFYKVIITRKDEEESSNTDIKSIKIKGYHLNFDKNSKTFYLNIDKEDTELDITVNLKDKNANYEIEGNENLEEGSVIKITVEAEDGTEDTYRIIIQKKDSNYIPLIIILISLLIIIGIVIFVVIKKNKSKKTNTKNSNTKKSNKEKKKETVEEEKTIEMPSIASSIEEKNKKSINNDEFENDEDDIIHIDNDEEEKTRILSYAEREELEKTKLLNDEEINDKIDQELEKTLLFNNYNDDEDE